MVECTLRSPVLSRKKQPVPYVFFASPAVKQVCPKSAACWSPRMPATGTPSSTPPAHVPYTSEEERMTGSMARGMRSAASMPSSQSRASMCISMVRLALVTSVTWTPPEGPPVRFQSSHVSTLPNSASPRSPASRTPGTWSRIHASLVAEK